MARSKRLDREQRRLWNALTGSIRPRDDIISQIDYMYRQRIINQEHRHFLLAECDREPSESVLWRRVVDAIVHHNRPRKRRRQR